MRFSVYLKTQDISLPAAHKTSREFAEKLVTRQEANKVGQNAIQLVSFESWEQIKNRVQKRAERRGHSNLKAPLAHYLPYNYPLPYELLRQYR